MGHFAEKFWQKGQISILARKHVYWSINQMIVLSAMHCSIVNSHNSI